MLVAPDVTERLIYRAIYCHTMSSAAHEFWTSDSEYKDLARTYEQNIERTHPGYVTSDGLCSRWEYWSSWAATAVDYYEYRGPDVKHIRE